MPNATLDGIEVEHVVGTATPLLKGAAGASPTTSSAHQLREPISGAALSPLMPPRQSAGSGQRWIVDSVASAS